MARLSSAAAGGVLAAAALALAACAPSQSATGPSAAPTASAATATPTSSAGPAPVAATSAGPAAVATTSAADWPTFDRTAARSGVSATTPAPAAHLSRAWSSHLDGDVYAQPLVVGGEVIVATENDSVYALSAATGRQLWKRHLASPVSGGLACGGDIDPSGITGTPVADPASGRLWVVTLTGSPTVHHTLWTLRLADGKVTDHRPADVPGSDPKAQQQRGALAWANDRVYVPYGGIAGDCGDYKGRILALPTAGGITAASFTTPNQREAGIWAPPGEAVVGGDVYTATGNGTPYGAVEDSDSVLRLTPSLSQVGRFTPSDYQQLSASDTDLGSTAPVPLPGGLLFIAGKQGVGYVLDAGHLGGTGGQLAKVNLPSGAFGGGAVSGDTVVVSLFDGLAAVHVSPGNSRTRPSAAVAWERSGFAAGPPIIAGGVVWDYTRGGALVGYRLATGARVIDLQVGAPPTSFPTLAASGSRLFVADGATVHAYLGA